MSSAIHYQPHYTVDDYRRWEGQWELWFGTAVAMGPSPYGPHERCVMRIANTLMNQIDEQNCDCQVYANLDWIVSNDTVVRPDIMVVCGEQPQEHLEQAPAIAVEVLSSSTRIKDRQYKRVLYEQQGVRHYLIVDTTNQSIEHFVLVDQLYQDVEPEEELLLELDGECSFRLNAAAIFEQR